MTYTKRDIAVMVYVAGLLMGMVVGFSACQPSPDIADHVTTGGRH